MGSANVYLSLALGLLLLALVLLVAAPATHPRAPDLPPPAALRILSLRA
jgi:hypothetical protein